MGDRTQRRAGGGTGTPWRGGLLRPPYRPECAPLQRAQPVPRPTDPRVLPAPTSGRLCVCGAARQGGGFPREDQESAAPRGAAAGSGDQGAGRRTRAGRQQCRRGSEPPSCGRCSRHRVLSRVVPTANSLGCLACALWGSGEVGDGWLCPHCLGHPSFGPQMLLLNTTQPVSRVVPLNLSARLLHEGRIRVASLYSSPP